MHIGVCGNCRYIDLLENLGSAANSGVFCPRCGTEMTSLGVGTEEWNSLNTKQRENLIRDKIPTLEDLFGPRPKIEPLIENEEDTNKTTDTASEEDSWDVEVTDFDDEVTEDIEGAEDTEDTVLDAPKPEEPEPEDEPDPEPDIEPSDEVSAEFTQEEVFEPAEEISSEITEEVLPHKTDEYDIEQVYVCYKCNTIAGHDGKNEKYYCSECGSDMVSVGYSVREWADLSKEEKRKVTEDARIIHMLSEIKRDDYGIAGADHTPSIINVVKDPDSAY